MREELVEEGGLPSGPSENAETSVRAVGKISRGEMCDEKEKDGPSSHA